MFCFWNHGINKLMHRWCNTTFFLLPHRHTDRHWTFIVMYNRGKSTPTQKKKEKRKKGKKWHCSDADALVSIKLYKWKWSAGMQALVLHLQVVWCSVEIIEALKDFMWCYPFFHFSILLLLLYCYEMLFYPDKWLRDINLQWSGFVFVREQQ